MDFVNVSFYKFLDLSTQNLSELKTELLNECVRLELKGTILLSNEGINGFLAGSAESILAIKNYPAILAMGELPYKDSISDHQPFTRMLVKIKKEIISMGQPEINPARFTANRLSAKELKQWLDDGKEVVILDTRNDYEVRIGTFDNAINMDLKTFRQFPHRVKELPEEIKNKPVVTFCTGGIRCEKASAVLLNEGFKDVYQLDGGILRYFEEVGGSYYNGECFVFDHRVALDAELKETETLLCYNCQNPVTSAEQKTSAYIPHVSCPHCISGKMLHKEKIADQLRALDDASH